MPPPYASAAPSTTAAPPGAGQPEGCSGRARWRQALRDRLRERPQPLLVWDDAATPGASLWVGARHWVETFRKVGLRPGDRLVVALPPGAPFVQVLVAALWEGITLAPVAPDANAERVLGELDARAAVVASAAAGVPASVGMWVPDGVAGPVQTLPPPRTAAEPPTEDVCFLLRTSGTEGAPRWVALSDANVFAVLGSHRPHLGLSESACVLSGLPWHHAFGLVLELLPALLAGAEIVRVQAPRDPEALLAAFDTWSPTHFSAVPLTVRRLLGAGGRARLHGLAGGIVGGAPIPPDVAEGLRGSALRVGYGQTEAGPGIALGEPGHFVPGYLGHPLGCTVRLASRGEVHFRGPNAHVGTWTAQHYRALDPDRWVATGDQACPAAHDPTAFTFAGRLSDSFKLSNGRFVQAGRAEATLRATVPGLLDAVLCTLDGEHLALALLMPAGAVPPAASTLRAALGPLGDRLTRAEVVAPETWVQHSKGTPDRAAIAHLLTSA
ncbi:MAG: AMP-binding protein [Bacteroidota bacterium]